MDEREIEAVAQRAVREASCMRTLASQAFSKYWPGWKPRSVVQRIDQQIDPHNGANPIQARLWFDVLRETGDDEMLAQAVDAHREGRARAAIRERDRAIDQLERVRVRRVEPEQSTIRRRTDLGRQTG